MALYALGDLHLSFQADKPMDVFGKAWRNHEKRIEKNCNKMLTDEDTLVGTKGYCYEGKDTIEHAEMLVEREAKRIKVSFEATRADGFEKFIVFLHYPPTSLWEKKSRFTLMAEAYEADQLIYAHCHGKERFHDSLMGTINGVKYSLVSGDYLEFKPQKILD